MEFTFGKAGGTLVFSKYVDRELLSLYSCSRLVDYPRSWLFNDNPNFFPKKETKAF